jgi:hypothetical protein
VTIDRHTSRIARDASPPPRPLLVEHLVPQPGNVSSGTICSHQKCVFGVSAKTVAGRIFDVSISDDEAGAVVTFPPAGATDRPRFEMLAAHSTRFPRVFDLGADHCGTGLMLGQLAFVEANDCNETGHASLYDLNGAIVESIFDRPDFNAYGAWPVDLGEGVWGIVAPAEYTVLIFDVPRLRRHDVIDLVPIQAESTPKPSFVETHAKDGTWLIASPTGGVGIIDPVRGVLANAWIIPRCEARP